MYDHSTRGPKPVGHPVLNIYISMAMHSCQNTVHILK